MLTDIQTNTLKINLNLCPVWWCTASFQQLGERGKWISEFEASQDYTFETLHQKKNTHNPTVQMSGLSQAKTVLIISSSQIRYFENSNNLVENLGYHIPENQL